MLQTFGLLSLQKDIYLECVKRRAYTAKITIESLQFSSILYSYMTPAFLSSLLYGLRRVKRYNEFHSSSWPPQRSNCTRSVQLRFAWFCFV